MEDLHAKGELCRLKMLYLVTYHQNPTGITLEASRKPAILALVKKYSALAGHRIVIVEDAAYRELAYTDDPAATPPSFRAFDKAGEHTVIAQTFSKPFAPGVKTGYGLLPKELVAPVKQAKGGRDFGSSNLCHLLLARVLASGDFDRHVMKLKQAYAAKGQAVVDALHEHFRCVPGVSWSVPKGGMYVWLTLPEGTDTGPGSAFLKAAMDEKVIYVPGCFCFPADPTRQIPTNSLRLAFGVTSPAQAKEGVRRLAKAWGTLAGK
jgi:2-aminoadipate transaminase